MPSILQGFEYDVFISYRQKDNKGDRWVSEFVDALKDELESTFKEEISLYFDINPHDGLHETHDVDASLEKKLKCIVFIPVISRTYCDPNSFAWEHEFRAFIELASSDQFGLKVILPGGNVANRVLPVRIHDLDHTDIKLFESTLGGVLRSIDFVHKETGVNRQLRLKDDNIIKGTNQIFYRDQINKVALAIKDIIESMKLPVPSNPVLEKKVQTMEGSGKTDPKSIKEVLKPAGIKRKKIIPWSKVITGSVIGLMAFIILTLCFIWSENSQREIPVHKLAFNLPQGDTLNNNITWSSELALSPDGTKLVFVVLRNDTTFLYLRYMNEFDSKPIPGTEYADGPFFSPDGNWIGYFSKGILKKISINGGASLNICEAGNGFEGCWGEDNYIIYEDDFKGVMRVVSTGGTPKQLTTSLKFSNGRLDMLHLWPKFLPGGKEILFTSFNTNEDMRIEAYSIETGKTLDLLGPGCQAQYIQPGYLVYAWKGNLMAVRFNLKQMKVTGQQVVILTGIKAINTSALFSISGNGSLAYIPGDLAATKSRPVLVDQKGKVGSLNFPAGEYGLTLSFSPDGKEVLIAGYEEQKSHLWIYGLERGTISRFTGKEYDAYWGIWSPDGKQIVFNSNLDGGEKVNLYMKNSDGSGPTKRLTNNKYYHQMPKCWSADGKLLLYSEWTHSDTTKASNPDETGMDIRLLPIDGNSPSVPFLNSRFNELHPTLSPDGQWLAYTSDEPGQYEVFVCSFPGRNNITQVSTGGGTEPVWAPDGKELYYRDITGSKVFTVQFIASPRLVIGKPVLLFHGNFIGSGFFGRIYDIAPDGKHFLMLEYEKVKPTVTRINIILNWFEELKKQLPAN